MLYQLLNLQILKPILDSLEWKTHIDFFEDLVNDIHENPVVFASILLKFYLTFSWRSKFPFTIRAIRNQGSRYRVSRSRFFM
jgi:hypothetical protein